MKKPRHPPRRSKRPRATRHSVPPPLIGPDTCHTFHPDLVDKFVYREGIGFFLPQTELSLAELLAIAPKQVVMTRHKRATITGYWWVPSDHKGPVPQFIFDKIRDAVDHDEAFLLLSDSERALARIITMVALVIGRPAGSA